MINYDLNASAADAVKVEIRLSRLSLPFQHSATRGSSFLFYVLLQAAFCLYLGLPFFIFRLSSFFFSQSNITCFCYLFQFFLFTFIFNSRVPEAGNLHQRHSLKVRRLVFKFIHLKVFPFFASSFSFFLSAVFKFSFLKLLRTSRQNTDVIVGIEMPQK